jgi:hypothetical protein
MAQQDATLLVAPRDESLRRARAVSLFGSSATTPRALVGSFARHSIERRPKGRRTGRSIIEDHVEYAGNVVLESGDVHDVLIGVIDDGLSII